MNEALHHAISRDDVAGVEAILKANPGLDIHAKGNEGQFTHLDLAILFGKLEIVKLFMDLPGVDLNQKNQQGTTPLQSAFNGEVEVLKLLLRDDRVRYPTNHILSPLFIACLLGKVENIMWVLYLRGREIKGKEVKWLIKEATDNGHGYLAELFKRFKADRELVIFQLNIELEPANKPALLFAMLAFLEDGLLKLKRTRRSNPAHNKLRFFKMALQLPIEVQMLLCYRVYELDDEYIPNKMALAAFKKFGAALPPRRFPFFSLSSCSVM